MRKNLGQESLKMKNKYLAISMVLGFSIIGHSALAQMDNRPFSFKGTPGGGIGMSIGGQQAILNDKILGFRPKNLVKNSSGILLDVTKGPGSSAIVGNEGNSGFLPKYKGTSYKGDNLEMTAGVFNSYFSPREGSYSGATLAANISSGSMVSTWTARVVSGAPVSFSPNSSVDGWTALVHTSY